MGYYKISSKGEKIKKFLICFLIFSLSLATVSAEKIVILAIDDFQVWWLEDVQDYVVDVHAANNIPITMGVIPAGIEDIWGGERFSSRLEEWDSKPQTEIAQHGYDHSIYLRGMSYAQQNYRINKGKDLLEDIGITPYSFIPPYGEADDTTIQVLINSGFHTFYDVIPLDLSPTSELLLLEEQLHLCKNDASGKSCEFKDYNNLKSEINEKIQEDGVALVLYHMQDFESSGGGIDTGKAAQVIGYAKKLKQEGYTLMTVEQYYQYLQYSECTIDSECGTDYDVDYCIGNEVWLDSHEFTCEIGSCNEDVTSVFQFDCGESYCEDWQYECRGNGVWRKRLCHNAWCSAGSCYEQVGEEEAFVEECNYGCTGGECVSECTPGEEKLCENQKGVCENSVQVCSSSGQWPGCDYSDVPEYQDNDASCDNKDNNCDGLVDEDFVETPTSCGVGICKSTGILTCVAGNEIDSCTEGTPTAEICDNSLDDDCDGKTDSEDSECQTTGNTIILRPNGQGQWREWRNLRCGKWDFEWQCVDEATPDTNDYLRDSWRFKETFVFSDTGLSQEKIKSITIFYYARLYLGTVNSCFEAMIRQGQVDYYSGVQMCADTEWDYLSFKYTENPATGLPWTVEEVDNLEAGMNSIEPNAGGSVAQVYVEVEYE